MIIRSMTGYGKAEKEFKNKKITVEIRSLNSKQLDLNLRLPTLYRSKEMELRTDATSKIQRGKADITLSIDKAGNQSNGMLNETVFKAYFEKIASLSKGLGVDPNHPEIIAAILRLPEVMDEEKAEPDDEEIDAIMACLHAAYGAFNSFREKEGQALMLDILMRLDTIEKGLTSIEPYEKSRLETIKSRIESDLNEIISKINVDRNRFEQELIYYIEKLDITEEKVRLKQHCTYFRQVAEQDGTPGRKLGFIAQEIGREINTIGSKANEATIQKIVVSMKDELEKIKEQLLNIL